METIKGYVKSIVFRNEENGYTVASLVADGEEITCVGSLAALDAGDLIEAEGTYTIHAVYGMQFKAVSYRVGAPSDAVETERYLASGAVKGIGEALAARIVARFGDDSFRIMEEEPERLSEVKGISIKKAQDIALSMREKADARAALIFLQRYGIGGVLAARIMARYGDEVFSVMRGNPYRLADEVEGIGFKTADEIALKIGISASSEYRVRGGILYALSRAAQEGDCFLPADILAERTRELLGVLPGEVFENELLQLQLDGRVVSVTGDGSFVITSDPNRGDDGHLDGFSRTCVYDAHLYADESACAAALCALRDAFEGDQVNTKEPSPCIQDEYKRTVPVLSPVLSEKQQRAVRDSMRYGVVIITGGPGTGKTTTIRSILSGYAQAGLRVVCAAPTGRAARRMSEATGYEARTIHRLLEVNGKPDEGGFVHARFERNEWNPLEADCVIIDEMSMVDIRLFAALLKAMRPGMRLVLVGDASQLPSVGPGQVLRDLIASDRFPTVVLDKIFRQEEASDIVINAHRIHRGERIALDNSAKDFFFLPRDDANVICKHIVELVRDKLPRYLKTDASQIQVLTPMKKGALGASALNTMLQRHLNPPAKHKREHDFGERTLREGDKVMQIKNNYQAAWEITGRYNIVTERGEGVFNGDLGVICEINEPMATLTVEFDEGRRVVYPFAQVNELELAYVMTIHKSQGSEYPAVVMPLLGGPRLLMNRNLLYTAVTRAKSLVVILGSAPVVMEMIGNEDQTKRYTGLRERLAEQPAF
ncbi:MAG: ATP-dependent RecD-like DNA helicase [Lachnospiraceae bacterium]|nr:ATP-dependent RecD-like DNA helicase [Lachnospiraceae bacterium]